MRYIRFLKTPRIIEEKNASRSNVHCLITVTSDLGDSFLPCDASLSAELCQGDSEEIIVWRTVQWKAGMRNLQITLPLSRSKAQENLRVRVGVKPKSSLDEFGLLQSHSLKGHRLQNVVSAWSGAINAEVGSKEAQKIVERRFSFASQSRIHILEDTGESIARHIWDAGIALSSHINEALSRSNPHSTFSSAFSHKKKQRLQVLELGTGCGIVGISIAQQAKDTDVVLTDLTDAEEIVHRNLRRARVAPTSTVRFQELDWDQELPAGIRETRFDTVVAADCTYNSDSSPALVRTIGRIAETSPDLIIIIAMKMRHSSEEIFFALMSEAGFTSETPLEVPLPGDHRTGEETVLIYTYRLKIVHWS